MRLNNFFLKTMNKNKIITFLRNKKMLLLSLVIVVPILFFLDIYTKRLAFAKVDSVSAKTLGIHNKVVITNYLNVVRVINTGVSFGMLNNLKSGSTILSIITISILIFVLYLLYKTKSSYYDLFAYSFIVAGGFGNLFDRIKYGGVYDFLDFHIFGYHWPAFNLADSLICIAVFMIIFKDIFLFFRKNRN